MTNKERAKKLDKVFEGYGDYVCEIEEALDAVERETLERAAKFCEGFESGSGKDFAKEIRSWMSIQVGDKCDSGFTVGCAAKGTEAEAGARSMSETAPAANVASKVCTEEEHFFSSEAKVCQCRTRIRFYTGSNPQSDKLILALRMIREGVADPKGFAASTLSESGHLCLGCDGEDGYHNSMQCPELTFAKPGSTTQTERQPDEQAAPMTPWHLEIARTMAHVWSGYPRSGGRGFFGVSLPFKTEEEKAVANLIVKAVNAWKAPTERKERGLNVDWERWNSRAMLSAAQELLDEIDGQAELGGPTFEASDPLREAIAAAEKAAPADSRAITALKFIDELRYKCDCPHFCDDCTRKIVNAVYEGLEQESRPDEQKTLFVWLLEDDASGPIYWGPHSERQEWTRDPNEAIKFQDQKSAERAALVIGGKWKAVEHGFG